MYRKRTFLAVMLALGLLLSAVAESAERIERTTDAQGTIHIGTPPPASKEKAGEVKAPAKPAAPEAPPPGLIPPTSRRQYGPAAETRRKALLERRQAPATPPKAPGPGTPAGDVTSPQPQAPAGEPGQAQEPPGN